MNDMTSFNYVDVPNVNLVCCICRMPFTDPWSTSTCGHTFCHECIARAIEHLPQCPIDRSPLSLHDLVPANPIVRHLVDELVVECPQRLEGCSQNLQRQLLASHIKDACQYVQVPCPEGECDQVVLRKDIREHAHDCVNRLTKCEGCGSGVRHTDLEAHESDCPAKNAICKFCSAEFPRSELTSHDASCSDYVIPCLQADNGCPWTGPRSDLSASHISLCPYESINGFFVLNSARASVLEDENTILKSKVEALEGIVQTMKREMQSIRTALGPWYQPEGSYPPSSRQTTSTERPFPIRARPTSFDLNALSSLPLPNQLMALASSSGSMSSGPQDLLAPYFPPETHEASSSWSEQRRSSVSFVGDASGRHYHESIPHTSVAPLNLSTTLEGSLNGLRDSVVTLSASVDSLARRTDIERRNETLRMNEEVSRLNYTVNGLRMQVHNVMMDRNAQVTGRTSDSWGEHDNGPPSLYNFFSTRLPSSGTKL